jgi:predicted PurR-regulated permease PerM
LAALALIPYIGSLIVAILCVFDSKAEGARFDQINKP